jgi:hypothetical protein
MAKAYDVCLSFAGEDRAYVEAVAAELCDRGISVFYDKYEEAALWGKNLYQHLDDVYRHKARYCVIFVSAAYATKAWAKHELASAQARAIAENREYVLPVRLDATVIPGLPPVVAYIDARSHVPVELAELIASKLTETRDNYQGEAGVGAGELPLKSYRRQATFRNRYGILTALLLATTLVAVVVLLFRDTYVSGTRAPVSPAEATPGFTRVPFRLSRGVFLQVVSNARLMEFKFYNASRPQYDVELLGTGGVYTINFGEPPFTFDKPEQAHTVRIKAPNGEVFGWYEYRYVLSQSSP